jgi:hypothetical protein
MDTVGSKITAEVVKVKNDKVTVIEYNGEKFIKESPYKGKKGK